MQMGVFHSYQKTKFADQLFNCKFNTEKFDASIAIAIKEVSGSWALADIGHESTYKSLSKYVSSELFDTK